MKFLIFADPLAGLKADFDTGLAFLREGLARGHTMYWCTPEDFVLHGTELHAYADHVLQCNEDQLPAPDQIKINTRTLPEAIRIRDLDGVWIRKDPPFDHAYLSICWLLSLEEKDVPIINPPSTLTQVHEKTLPILAVRHCVIQPDDVAPFVVSTGTDFEFPKDYTNGELITKPWYGYGGKGVRKWKSLKEVQGLGQAFKKDYVIFQHYLPSVSTRGDRRALFFNGELKAHFMRVPEPGMLVANIAQGAKPVLMPLTPKEDRICKALGPFFKKLGIILAGADFMDERLSEVNVTAPSGIQLARKLCGVPLATDWVQYAEALALKQKRL